MKLFACDLDNTLIPQQEEVDRDNINELNRLLKLIPNLKIAYISGRNFTLTLKVLSEHHLLKPDFIASDVGNSIYVLKQGEWSKSTEYQNYLAATGFDQEKIKRRLKNIKNIYPQEKENQSKFKLSYYLDLRGEYKYVLSDIKQILKKSSAQLIYSEDELKNIGLLDIVPKKGGKAGALKFLAEKIGAKKDKVVYAGDSGNDLDALNVGFKGILVGNASKDLRDFFSQESSHVYVAKNKFSGGVIEGIRYFFSF